MLPRYATSILWLILLIGALVGAPLRALSEGEPIEADAQGKAKFRREQSRPIKLGTSGGSVRDRSVFPDSIACCSGTLGGLVEKNGKLFVLSNNHVIARGNKGKKGEAIIQPGYLDQNPVCQVPSEDETIAHLRAWKRLKFGGTKKNRVDAALGEVVPGEVDPSGKVLKIGIPGTTPVDPAIGMEVKKSGRTTGLTRGIIFAVDVEANVTFEQGCGTENEKTARFVNQFAIVGNNKDFSKGGDSGSMVYRNESDCPAPVGLIFAGSDTISVANPIRQVLKQLSRRPPRGDIDLVGCAQAENESEDFDFEASSSSSQATSQDASELLMSDPEVKFAQRVLARQKNRLLRSSQVFGVGLGLATTGAPDPVVNIFVDRDRPDSWSDLPSSIEGIRTEIVPTGPFVAACAASVLPSSASN